MNSIDLIKVASPECIDYDDWLNDYLPEHDIDGSVKQFDSIPEGIEQEYVWTVVDCDGELVTCSGYAFVNRMHYHITIKPWDHFVEVTDDTEPEDFDRG